jgi:hypothetical protein
MLRVLLPGRTPLLILAPAPMVSLLPLLSISRKRVGHRGTSDVLLWPLFSPRRGRGMLLVVMGRRGRHPRRRMGQAVVLHVRGSGRGGGGGVLLRGVVMMQVVMGVWVVVTVRDWRRRLRRMGMMREAVDWTAGSRSRRRLLDPVVRGRGGGGGCDGPLPVVAGGVDVLLGPTRDDDRLRGSGRLPRVIPIGRGLGAIPSPIVIDIDIVVVVVNVIPSRRCRRGPPGRPGLLPLLPRPLGRYVGQALLLARRLRGHPHHRGGLGLGRGAVGRLGRIGGGGNADHRGGRRRNDLGRVAFDVRRRRRPRRGGSGGCVPVPAVLPGLNDGGADRGVPTVVGIGGGG